MLKAGKLTSHIQRESKRGESLPRQTRKSNRTKSTLRVRIEHIFGMQANDTGGTHVRTIGLVWAKASVKAKIGIRMKTLAYNMRRPGQPGRLNPCPA